MENNKTFKIHEGMQASDGAGVKLYRIIGTPYLDNIDPFVMLDEFRSENPDDYIAGFPPHPHRGIETITYMKKGKFKHRDSTGQEGILGPGSVQWMNAGRGIIHSEMPMMENGELWGYQLWLNLPQEYKMTMPIYQNLDKEDIPVYSDDKFEAKIISGKFKNVTGPANSMVPANYFDMNFKKDSKIDMSIGLNQRGFVFVYSGKFSIQSGDDKLTVITKQLLEFGNIDKLVILGEEGSGCLFLSGLPNNEPIVKGGPFVMNTKAEITQAFFDYQSGQFGLLD